jgi:hypothetical protein
LDFAELIGSFDQELIANIEEVGKTKQPFSNYTIEVETKEGEKKVFEVACSILEHSRERK